MKTNTRIVVDLIEELQIHCPDCIMRIDRALLNAQVAILEELWPDSDPVFTPYDIAQRWHRIRGELRDSLKNPLHRASTDDADGAGRFP